MKRQMSSASCVSSTVARPPTTQRSDTLDSNTTPVGPLGSEADEEEGDRNGGTLTRRRRSGAFSYHGRGSVGDSSTLGSRGSGTLERGSEGGGRTPEAVRRLVRERGRQVLAGKSEDVEDEVFQGAKCEISGDDRCDVRVGEGGEGDDVMHCENDVMVSREVFWETPEVRVECGSPELDSCWIVDASSEESETPLVCMDTCLVSGEVYNNNNAVANKEHMYQCNNLSKAYNTSMHCNHMSLVTHTVYNIISTLHVDVT